MKVMLAFILASIGVLPITGVVFAKEPIDPISPIKNINLGQVELGKKLYFDPRLSKSG